MRGDEKKKRKISVWHILRGFFGPIFILVGFGVFGGGMVKGGIILILVGLIIFPPLPKSLTDRFWWIVPPLFLTFVYWPGIYGDFFTLDRYVRVLRYLFMGDMDVGHPMFFWAYFLFGFMAVGMLLTRRLSLTLRIIVPIISGILGHFIGLSYAFYISDFFLN